MSAGRSTALNETPRPGENIQWWRVLVVAEDFTVATSEVAIVLSVNQLDTGEKWTELDEKSLSELFLKQSNEAICSINKEMQLKSIL